MTLKNLTILTIMVVGMLLLSSCTSKPDDESSSIISDLPSSSTSTNSNDSKPEESSASSSGQKRPLPEAVAQEPLPEIDENGKPYVDTSTSYKFEDVPVHHPWDLYPILDSVIKLTEEDLTGSERFIGDQIYCFIDAEGLPGDSASLPIGDNLPPAVELYLSATDAVTALQEGDIFALDGIPMWATGSVQQIYKIHPQVGNVVHFTTIAPHPDEFLDR